MKVWALGRLSLALRGLSWVLLRVLPPRRYAVVHGWPDSEGNAVEVVRGLSRRYSGCTFWLLDDVSYRGPASAERELGDTQRIVRVKKSSARGLYLSLTAEVVFFTHGLYTAVDPPSNRLVVNLWHGDGPKGNRDVELIRSSVVVSGSVLWGRYKGRIFQVPPESVAVVGNPRVDQFSEPLPESALRQLGLSPGRRTVLWLPTFREGRGSRGRTWSDGRDLTASSDLRAVTDAMVEAARRLSLDLVVKPHPMDVASYEGTGLPVLTGDQLNAAGISLYQLLGHCAGLISDVSSVWVDYLVLNRPIAFYVPDMEELRKAGRLNVDDLAALLPGARIEDGVSTRRFLEGVAQDDASLRPAGHPALVRIGPAGAGPVTERLLDWLDDHQRARDRRALFEKPKGRTHRRQS